jgi:hypothetical protein
MPRDPLLTYLRDHLAGAVGALEMLEFLRSHAGDEEIRTAATTFHAEIAADREVLESLAQRLGGGSSAIKDASAWVAEKLSRLKLGAVGDSVGGLPLFEAVEGLALGIAGKIALWDTLIAIARDDPSMPKLDYYSLRQRAQQQHDRMELHRLRLATLVFNQTPPVVPTLIPNPVLAV